ncbi:MAG: carbohydrate porin, partial [Alphaproteobacteria bacterium]|nr:carbohydrate porin [Alphaproteobacteria bacterium]
MQLLRGATVMLLGAMVSMAHGAEIPPGLFGDWGGLRAYLADHGVDLELSYINESAVNVRGGDSREAAYADQFYFGGWLDLKRLLGVPGARIVF